MLLERAKDFSLSGVFVSVSFRFCYMMGLYRIHPSAPAMTMSSIGCTHRLAARISVRAKIKRLLRSGKFSRTTSSGLLPFNIQVHRPEALKVKSRAAEAMSPRDAGLIPMKAASTQRLLLKRANAIEMSITRIKEGRETAKVAMIAPKMEFVAV